MKNPGTRVASGPLPLLEMQNRKGLAVRGLIKERVLPIGPPREGRVESTLLMFGEEPQHVAFLIL